MTRRCIFFLFAVGLGVAAASGRQCRAQIDPQATRETKILYRWLKELAPETLLFGHQNTIVTGIGWKSDDPADWKSDVERAVGDFPAVFGFDFIDGVEVRKRQVEEVFRRGGIITYSWHARNPVTGGNYLDKRGDAVRAILPGGAKHDYWCHQLDRAAAFFDSLEVDGVKVPVIFRPFHENTNGHFWWSHEGVQPEDFVQAWRFTVTYLRDRKGVHNLLYAYSPSRPAQLNGLTDGRYPGDDWVDIVGFDCYWGGGNIADMIRENCRVIVRFAREHGKVAAITEAGVGQGISNATIDDWFTRCILEAVYSDEDTQQVVYWLTWRNASPEHHWVPVPAEPLHADFVRFYQDARTTFLGDLPDMYGLRTSSAAE
ncbi:glycosyl hydrolase [Thermostilla marina]